MDLKSIGSDTMWVRPPPALQVANLSIFRPKPLYLGGIWQGKKPESPRGVELFD
jgi:hypothetical protein